MADAQLSVELSAQVNGFVTALTQAATASSRTDGVVTAMSNNISRNIANVNRLNLSGFQRSLQAGQVSLTRLQATVSAAPQQLSRLSVGSNQAAFALTNLGRVAQDAPFGFIGIQNNLNPLLESFQRLRTESGSNAAALRALGQSLIGPAGIGVALSLVTAAITFYTMWQQKANKATKETKESTDDYINSLEAVEGALLKGQQNAAKEISNLRVLYDLYQNANIPLSKRRDAYREIQKEYPAYFGNLKFEANATAVTTQAYEKLTLSIIATAKARALSDKIGENSIKEAELQNKILNTQNEINKSKKEDTGFAAALGGSRETQGLLEDQVKLQTQLNALKDQDARLSKEITKQVQGQAEVKGNFDQVGEIESQTKATRGLSDVLKDLNIDLAQAENTFGATFGDVRKDKVAAYQKAIEDLIKLGFKPAGAEIERLKGLQSGLFDGDLMAKDSPFGNLIAQAEKPLLVQPVLSIKPIITGVPELEKTFEDLKTSINELAYESIGSTLNNISGSIGEAIASGGNVLEAAGKALLGSFGSFLSEYGRLLIAYGLAATVKGKLDLASAIPGGGIIAGPAAIAAGIALQVAGAALGAFASGKSNQQQDQYNGVKKIPGFASGVTNFGGGLAMVGEVGRELVQLPQGSNVIPNSRTERLMKGGSGNQIMFSTELGIEMGQLVARIRQTEKQLNRLG